MTVVAMEPAWLQCDRISDQFAICQMGQYIFFTLFLQIKKQIE